MRRLTRMKKCGLQTSLSKHLVRGKLLNADVDYFCQLKPLSNDNKDDDDKNESLYNLLRWGFYSRPSPPFATTKTTYRIPLFTSSSMKTTSCSLSFSTSSITITLSIYLPSCISFTIQTTNFYHPTTHSSTARTPHCSISTPSLTNP